MSLSRKQQNGTYPRRRLLSPGLCGADNLVPLNVCNLRPRPELVKYTFCEATSVPVDVTIIDLLDAGDVPNERVGLVETLEEVQVAKLDIRVDIVLEHDDVRIVDGTMGVLADKEGDKTYWGALGTEMGKGGKGDSDDDGDAREGHQCPAKERRHDRSWEGNWSQAPWIQISIRCLGRFGTIQKTLSQIQWCALMKCILSAR